MAHHRRQSGIYRDAQDRLLWRDKTCPARTYLIMSWKKVFNFKGDRVGLPIRQRQALQDLTLAGDSTQLAALVHSGHAKAAVALHAAPYQQPVPWLKDVQLHFLPYIHCVSELAFVAFGISAV